MRRRGAPLLPLRLGLKDFLEALGSTRFYQPFSATNAHARKRTARGKYSQLEPRTPLQIPPPSARAGEHQTLPSTQPPPACLPARCSSSCLPDSRSPLGLVAFSSSSSSSRRRAMEDGRRAVRTVRVRNISDLAGEREVREFFSFSGEIEHVDIRLDGATAGRTAYVTFKDPKALEIALLLSGATIVDRVVNITSAEDYIYIPINEQQLVANGVTSTAPTADLEEPTEANASPTSGRVYASKAHDVMTTVIARGSAIRQDAVNKAKSFDEKHQLRANATARINSFDRRVGLSEKLNTGISVVNEKVKTVDQRLHVSDKTMAALLAAERKLNDTGSAVKTNRYVSAGTSWLNGAFSKVAKAGHVAGSRTREKFQLAVSNISAKVSQ
uniref:Uncharacterized protein n=1 Tax=Avena sativa TaxID=4498 RepID=A0ACD5WBT1_AVESA